MSLETFEGKIHTIHGQTGHAIALETVPLSQGKLSSVYRGTDYDGIRVAAKIFNTPDVTSNIRPYRLRRAANEAAMTARASAIAPEGVIPFRRLDIDVATDRPFLVMHYAHVGSLERRMHDENGEISNRDAVNLLAGVSQTAGILHKNGIVHRDIKPDNIYIDYDENDVFKGLLGDLSLAVDMSIGDAITAEGMLLGTPRYLSPEAMRGRGDIPPVDVWGLGVTAFTVLEGEHPYQHTTSGNLLELFDLITHDVPVLRDVFGNPILDKGLRETIQSAMAIDPEDRPSATEFSYRLAELADDAKKAKVQEVPLSAISTLKKSEPDGTQAGVVVQVVFDAAS